METKKSHSSQPSIYPSKELLAKIRMEAYATAGITVVLTSEDNSNPDIKEVTFFKLSEPLNDTLKK